MTWDDDKIYSASCPVCGYEHDFTNRQTMERVWKKWLAAALQIAREQKAKP
jgi:hypothetical protein